MPEKGSKADVNVAVSWKRAPLLSLRFLIARARYDFHMARADRHDGRAEAALREMEAVVGLLREIPRHG